MLNLAFLVTAIQCGCTDHGHWIVWKQTLWSRIVGTVKLMIKYCKHCLSHTHKPLFPAWWPHFGKLAIMQLSYCYCSWRIIKAWLAHWRFIFHISPFSVKLQVRLAVQPGSSRAHRRNYSSSIEQRSLNAPLSDRKDFSFVMWHPNWTGLFHTLSKLGLVPSLHEYKWVLQLQLHGLLCCNQLRPRQSQEYSWVSGCGQDSATAAME